MVSLRVASGLFVLLLPFPGHGQPGTGWISLETSGGGRPASSSSMSVSASVGDAVHGIAAGGAAEVRLGLAYETYTTTALGAVLTGGLLSLAEGASWPVEVVLDFDDGTRTTKMPHLALSEAAGAVAAFDPPAGFLQTASVVEDSPGSLTLAYLGQSQTLNLTVLNIGDDDYKGYANDGIDDLWQFDIYGDDNPEGYAGADSDGDFKTTLWEYAFGTDARDSRSGPEGEPELTLFNVFGMTGGGITFRRLPGPEADLTLVYTPQASSDLRHWIDLATPFSETVLPNGMIEVVYPDVGPTPAGEGRFYRVLLTPRASGN